jgi:hypothetical protein
MQDRKDAACSLDGIRHGPLRIRQEVTRSRQRVTRSRHGLARSRQEAARSRHGAARSGCKSRSDQFEGSGKLERVVETQLFEDDERLSGYSYETHLATIGANAHVQGDDGPYAQNVN